MHPQLNGKVSTVGVLVLALTFSVLTSSLLACPHDHSMNKRSGHHISKRSWMTLNCKGVFDRSIFARVQNICEDCYNLFREHELYRLCRENCFTSDYFQGCVEALQLTDELESIKTGIKQLHGADPFF